MIDRTTKISIKYNTIKISASREQQGEERKNELHTNKYFKKSAKVCNVQNCSWL